MGKYRIDLTDLAKKQLKEHRKAGDKVTLAKIEKIFEELSEHPFEGSGQPEALKYDLKGYWSRRINRKDRIIYEVIEQRVTVDVVSVKGHYGDK